MCRVGHIVKCISCMSCGQKYLKDIVLKKKKKTFPLKLGYLWSLQSSEVLCRSHQIKHLPNTYSYGGKLEKDPSKKHDIGFVMLPLLIKTVV